MLRVTIVRVDELHEKGIILTVSLIIIFNASSSMTRTLLIHLRPDAKLQSSMVRGKVSSLEAKLDGQKQSFLVTWFRASVSVVSGSAYILRI
jgi:hypothetical protein